jgi:hypothetical protein
MTVKRTWGNHCVHVVLFTLAFSTSAGRSNAEDVKAEPMIVEAAGLKWHSDYYDAYRAARSAKRMLLVSFVPLKENATQESFDKYIEQNAPVRKKLAAFELVRLPVDATIEIEGKPVKLLSHPGFVHLNGQPGIAVVDLANKEQDFYGEVVTSLPYGSGKYYRWQNSHLAAVLDLPAGTLTQRTMVWAVRTHPEAPQSTTGDQSPALANAAEHHSQHQAAIGVQGHHQWESRFHQITSQVGAGTASEVVAESWPNQNMVDSCIDCVQSWRHSSGHWGAVRSPHRMFGYDIRRGGNGIWYGTGIFEN